MSIVLAGCAYEARMPAAYFAETADVLAPGHVAVTGAAGVAGTQWGGGGGVGARVRVGVGGDQEIGVEAAGVELDAPSHHCELDCQTSTSGSFTTVGASAQASWKMRGDNRAVIVTLGGSRHHLGAGEPSSDSDFHGKSVTGSVAILRSWPLGQGSSAGYLGVRLSGAVPVGAREMSARPLVGSAIALGLSGLVTDHVRAYAEIGPRMTTPIFDGFLVAGSLGLAAVVGSRFDW